MTTATEPMTTNDTWTAEIAQLRNRYKTVREPILACLNLLMHDPNINDTDAKARAAMRGVRITAASINGARNLLAKQTTEVAHGAATPKATPAKEPRPAVARRPRAGDAPVDVAALIGSVVQKIQGRGNAEADRLRDAVRKAIATLQAAVE